MRYVPARRNPWEEIEPGIMFDPDARNSELLPEWEVYENPFYVTPGGQAVGAVDIRRDYRRGRPMEEMGLHVRTREFDPKYHSLAASGAAFIEDAADLKLTIKKVGNTYHIFDSEGRDTGKYAFSLDKAQDIVEKLASMQA